MPRSAMPGEEPGQEGLAVARGRWLARSCAVTLAVALLLVAANAWLAPGPRATLGGHEEAARLAISQRVLVERAAKLALLVENASTAEQRTSRAAALMETAERLDLEGRRLAALVEGHEPEHGRDPRLQRSMDSSEALREGLVAAARELALDAVDPAGDAGDFDALVAEVLRVEGPLVTSLREFVTVFDVVDEDGRAHAALVVRILSLVALVALALHWGLQVRPAARRLARELRAADEQHRALREDLAEATRLAAFAHRTTHHVLLLDADGRVRWANDAFLARSGRRREEVVGGFLHDIVGGSPNAKPAEEQLARAIADGQPARVEIENVDRDGHSYWVLVEGTPLFDAEGRRAGYLQVQADITDRRDAEQALREARDAAEAGMTARAEFLANMSHEIRTPLNAIVGMTGLLGETPLDPQQRDFLNTARVSADALLALVNDILDFSKIDAGRMVLEEIPLDLASTVDAVADLVAQPAHEKGLEVVALVERDAAGRYLGDPSRLRQILLNLASNAVKFTERGEVALVARVVAREPSARARLRLEVRDTGIGIREEDIPRLFRSFTQVDASTTRRFGGTGLGLAISKRLVEMMGGEIGVQSNPGLGSTFWIEVPLLHLGRAEGDAAGGPLAGRRALVVDDSELARRALREQLLALGMEALVAPDAGQAVQIARDAVAGGRAPDFCLVDQRLPGGGAEGMAKLLREALGDAAPPVVALSMAREDATTPARGLLAGAIAKPPRPVAIAEVLGALLGGQPLPAPPAKPLIESATARQLDASAARILLVEDNPVNQKVARHLLKRAGLDCDTASNGSEALEAVLARRYDLVLMDCQMPVMDGHEASRRIREAERALRRRRVTIVAMTAEAMAGDRQRCLDAGMDDYLSKPIEPALFFDTLQRHLGGRGRPPSSRPDSNTSRPGANAFAGIPPRVQQVLNRERLQEATGGGGAAALLLEMFQSDLDQKLPRIQAAFGDGGDTEEIARLAHGLKGSALNVGAEQLARAALKLEMAAEVRDEGLAKRQAQSLATCAAEFREAAAAVLEELKE